MPQQSRVSAGNKAATLPRWCPAMRRLEGLTTMNSQPIFSREELLRIARSQKAIITLILVNLLFVVGLVWCLVLLVMTLGPESKSTAVMVLVMRWAMVFLNLVAVVFVFRLAKALRQTAWIYAVAALVPYVGIVTLLLINHFATRALRRHGVRVGLMGAVKSDLECVPPVAHGVAGPRET